MSVGQDGSSDTKPTPAQPTESAPAGEGGVPKTTPDAGVGEGSPSVRESASAAGSAGVEKAGVASPEVKAALPKSAPAVSARESQPLGSAAGVAPQLSTTQAIAGTAMLLGLLLIAYFVRTKVLKKGARGAVSAASSASAEDAELVRDMRELTGRLAAELDAKAERIERLIKAADERLRALEAMPKETRLIEPKPEARRAAAYDAGHRDVYELADAGLSIIEIAQKLDRPTGQVELILNLRKGTVAL